MFLFPRPADRSKGFLRVPERGGAIAEELTPQADTPHASGARSRCLSVKPCEAAAAFERLLSSTNRFPWHCSDCRRLRGDRQRGSAGAGRGIWNRPILRQSSRQLPAESSAAAGMQRRRGLDGAAGVSFSLDETRASCPISPFQRA